MCPNDIQYVDAYLLRSVAYQRNGNYDLAIEDRTWLISVQPNNSLFYRDRGLLYAEKGDYERTIKDYESALEIEYQSSLHDELEKFRKKLKAKKK